MRFYSYVIARDYGFAPNPFGGMCTLATCKPGIRKGSVVGDWVFGTGSASTGYQDHLIFAMRVTEKITFNEYWEEARFQTKKPIMSGSSLKKMYGDNIYYRNSRRWCQANSHHSLEDGSINKYNLERDTSVDAVLISDDFFYFGQSAIKIHSRYADYVVKRGPGYRCPETIWGSRFVAFLQKQYAAGYHDDPIWFEKFKRYDGVS